MASLFQKFGVRSIVFLQLGGLEGTFLRIVSAEGCFLLFEAQNLADKATGLFEMASLKRILAPTKYAY